MAKEIKNEINVMESAILEYRQILEVAKSKIAESHSKELDEMITKMLSESENVSLYKEPVTVNEESLSTEITNEESAIADGNVEAIDMKDASMKEIEEAFDAASDEDEFKVVKTDDNNNDEFSLTDIEGEISEVMSEIDAAENVEQVEPEVDNLTKIKQIHEEMGKMIEQMNSEKDELAMKENFHKTMTETFGEGYEDQIGMNECGKMFETWKSKATAKGAEATAEPIQEESAGKTFMPKSKVPGTNSPNSVAGGGAFPSKAIPAEKTLTKASVKESEEVVDETHGVGLSVNKLTGAESMPRVDVAKDYAKDKVRAALQKEGVEKLQKRINSLVNENFELTKQSNKVKSAMSEMTKMNESYKTAIDKYRNQLNEMALVSTNIVNVNNILVNESLALSFEDKKNIINDFKQVKSLEESEKTYKKIIKEYSETRKTIKESFEQQVNTGIESSFSTEVKETGNTQLNEHVEKLKRLSTYKSKN